MASMNNELLLHGKGSNFTPQRRSSPQPRSSSNHNKQMDSRRGDKQNSRLSASAKAFQPAPRSVQGNQQDVGAAIDKAELAQQVLASISIKRKEDQDRMLGLYPSDPRRRLDRRGSKHDWRKKDDKHHHKSKSGKHHLVVQKQADLGMNRFRFLLSPSSCYCDSSMEDILAMQTTDLWPHVSAVVTCDVDPICSICLDEIHAGRALACGHVFCAVCINRCLEAAEADPMLQKCPVCSEGALSKSQLRRCIVLKSAQTSMTPPTYSLVMSTPRTALPPLLITDRTMTNRVMVATGEGMLKMIEKERKEIAECKRDLERFRDAQGLRLIQDISSELDKAHVEWQRHVGRTRARVDVGAMMMSGEQVEWTYQRSDGSMEFLHPVNLRCLLSNCHGDVSLLPERITTANVLEMEEWSNRKFGSMVKLGPMHLPEFPQSIKVVEVALEGMSLEATQTVEKETKDRARRREERETRKLKQQLKVMEEEATVEEKRRRAREQEEELIRAFFGFEQRRVEEELKEARERPQPAINSFSAVVSSMGHFPVLTKSPSLEPSKAPPQSQQQQKVKTSPQLEPLKSAWGSASPTPAPSLSLSSSSNGDQTSSFAQAATQGPGKKVLWSNNPSRRAW